MNKKALVILQFLLGIVYLNSYSQTLISPQDADAELAMVKTKIMVLGTQTLDFTIATAFFKKVENNNTLLLAPNKLKTANFEVKCNNTLLNFSRFDTSYLSIDTVFKSLTSYDWRIYDLTDSNTVIDYTTSKPVSNVSNFTFTQSPSINRSNGFNYNHPIIYADSIVYLLGTDSITHVKKTILNQSNGVNFTSAELSALNTYNNGSLAIIIFNAMPQVVNNRKYYFQNNGLFVVSPLQIN
jgi:hypothetical protein